LIQCKPRPCAEEYGCLPERKRIDYHQHVTNAFTDRRIVEIERLQQPTALPVRFDSFAVLAR
jgi:hypothetical protein